MASPQIPADRSRSLDFFTVEELIKKMDVCFFDYHSNISVNRL